MRRQRGVSLTGLILVSAVLIVVLLLAFKVFPVYLDYQKVQGRFKTMAEDSKIRSVPTIGNVKATYYTQNAVDEVKSFDPETIQVRKEGGGIVISAEYQVKVPLFRNVAACFDFAPSSDK